MKFVQKVAISMNKFWKATYDSKKSEFYMYQRSQVSLLTHSI